MLKCKICQLNDTDSTTGMCKNCLKKWWFYGYFTGLWYTN